MKWEVLVGDMSRNGKFYNFSRNKGFNRPAAQVDHWGTCREMGSASGRHVAKWEVLVGDMSRNGKFYWATCREMVSCIGRSDKEFFEK